MYAYIYVHRRDNKNEGKASSSHESVKISGLGLKGGSIDRSVDARGSKERLTIFALFFFSFFFYLNTFPPRYRSFQFRFFFFFFCFFPYVSSSPFFFLCLIFSFFFFCSSIVYFFIYFLPEQFGSRRKTEFVLQRKFFTTKRGLNNSLII